MDKVKESNVAGTFYPADKKLLSNMIDQFIADNQIIFSCLPKALIVPHAGYIYSGPIASSAYGGLKPFTSEIKDVVILSPTHYWDIATIAVSDVDYFSTPLGRILVNKEKQHAISACKDVQILPQAFEKEHALEVHLPFLQKVLHSFQIIPLIIGQVSPESISKVLSSLDDDNTIFIVSSDLSHFNDYQAAIQLDKQTSIYIEQLDYSALNHHDACGFYPLRGLLQWVKKQGYTVKTLDLRNSGDTAGDKSRVVGYGSYAISK